MSDCYVCQDATDHVDAEHPAGQPCPSGITRDQMDWLVEHHPIFEAARAVERAFEYIEEQHGEGG